MSPSALRSSFRSALCVASVLAALSAPARAAEPPPWEARARGALVHAETVYVEATAVLVGDQRTLVAVATWIDAGRAIELRVPSATGERVVEAATRQVDHPLAPTWLLTSPVDVAAEPLTLSEIAFAPGVQVFVFAGHAGATRDTKLVATMIASTTAESEHVRVTGDHWSFVPGSPVLDQDGRLMGVPHRVGRGRARARALGGAAPGTVALDPAARGLSPRGPVRRPDGRELHPRFRRRHHAR